MWGYLYLFKPANIIKLISDIIRYNDQKTKTTDKFTLENNKIE